MIDDAPALRAEIARQIHPGLRLDVSIELGRECGVVFGRSGAGKTSLLRMIAGLDRPDSGRIVVNGVPWFDGGRGVNLPLRSRGVGMIFQDDRLFPHLDVSANIAFGLKGKSRGDVTRRIAEVASVCGVERLLDRRPSTLSGGERQRVGLARALAPRPKLLLADEPVSALDLDSRFGLIEQIRRIPEIEGIPVLLVTHSPAEAIALGGRAFVLDGGKIVDQGSALDVLSRGGRSMPNLDEIFNLFRGRVAIDSPATEETWIELEGGPRLVIPYKDLPAGHAVTLSIGSGEIVLARGEILGLSARNLIVGVVDRVIGHAGGAEVLIRTGGIKWIVSVVPSAVESLGLVGGGGIQMIVKARSCRLG